jgi:hypothetical protein
MPSGGQPLLQTRSPLVGANFPDAEGDFGNCHAGQCQFRVVAPEPGDCGGVRRLAQRLRDDVGVDTSTTITGLNEGGLPTNSPDRSSRSVPSTDAITPTDRLGQVPPFRPTFLRLGLASRPLSTLPTQRTVGLIRDLRGFLAAHLNNASMSLIRRNSLCGESGNGRKL